MRLAGPAAANINWISPTPPERRERLGPADVGGSLTLAAAAGGQFAIDLDSLSGSAPGLAANFHRNQTYQWQIAIAAGGITGFAPAEFTVNTSGFLNDLAGGTFGVSEDGNSLYLNFEPDPPASGPCAGGGGGSGATAIGVAALNVKAVPEPSTLLLLAAGAIGLLGWAWRRRKRISV